MVGMLKLFILLFFSLYSFADEVDGRALLHDLVYYEKYSEVLNCSKVEQIQKSQMPRD